MAKSRRVILRIEITPEAKACSIAVCEEFGMTQVSMMSRLVEFLNRCPYELQCSILSRGSEMRRAASSREVVELIAERKRSKSDK